MMKAKEMMKKVLLMAAAMGLAALPIAVQAAETETLCSGESAEVKLDLATGTMRTPVATETLTYSTEWDGGSEVTLAVNGTTLESGLTGSGTYDWTPSGEGLFTLTHTAATSSDDVVLSATFMTPPKYVAPVYVDNIASNGIAYWTTNTVPDGYTVVESAAARVTWGTAGATSWYVVIDDDIQIDGGVQCKGNVHLVLCDGAKLTVTNVADYNAGIATDASGSFTIYGTPEGAGELSATAGRWLGAGIGGGDMEDGSHITINGGTVTATSGSYGAGIGGGSWASGTDIVINGGIVYAKCIETDGGAGIGGGRNDDIGVVCSGIVINGGVVYAEGGFGSAAIGGGYWAKGSNIAINGGKVSVYTIQSMLYSGEVEYADVGDFIGSGTLADAAENVSIADSANVCFNLSGVYQGHPPPYKWIEEPAPSPKDFEGFVIMTPSTQRVDCVLVGGVKNWTAAKTFALTNAVTGATGEIVVNGEGVAFANKLLSLPHTDNKLMLTAERYSMINPPMEVANTTAKVYTNAVEDATLVETPIAVRKDAAAYVVYTAADGYVFADGSMSKTNVIDTSVNPATAEAPAAPVLVVAKIESTGAKYTSLAAAVAAAADSGDTITMLANDTLTASVTTGKGFTLDLNGKTIDGGDQYGFLFNGSAAVTVTISDSSGNDSGRITHCAKAGTADGLGAIKFSNANGTLVLDGGTLCDNSLGGSTASGVCGAAIFMSSGAFTMNGGVISNNTISAANGGGVSQSNGTFTMNGGRIVCNTAGNRGGGVALGGNGIMILNGGTVGFNQAAQQGGGIYLGGTGASLTVNGGEIVNNRTTSGHAGGVMVETGTFASMTGGVIANNSAGNHGGGIYNPNGLTITGGVITNNVAKGNGGGLYVKTLTASNVLIADNVSQSSGSGGGGLMLVGSSAVVSLGTGTVIRGNRASAGNGGGIYVYGDTGKASPAVTIAEGCVISNNVSSKSGGGLFVYPASGNVTINGGTFACNRADGSERGWGAGGGAVYIWNGGTVNVNGGTFDGNTAKGGGAFYVYKGTLNVAGGTITRSNAGDNANGNGWGIWAYNDAAAKLNVSGGTIDASVWLHRATTGSSIAGGRFDAVIKCNAATSAAVTLQGGVFTESAKTATAAEASFVKLIAPACAFVANTDAETVATYPWMVDVAPAVIISADGTTTNVCATLAAAVANVANDETIRMQKDNGEVVTTPPTATRFTFDGNGKTLTGSIAAAPGYGFVSNGDGTCSYIFFAAQIVSSDQTVTNKYATLAAAIDAAEEEDVITLLADLTEAAEVPYAVSVDFAGHTCGTLTAPAGHAVVAFSGRPDLHRTFMDSWERPDYADLSWYTADPFADTFVISSAAGLAGLAQLVNGKAFAADGTRVVLETLYDQMAFYGQTIELAADIDLTAHAWVPIGAGFCTTVHDGYAANYFTGTFDGCGHRVAYALQQQSAFNEYDALFGALYAAEVRNLALHVTADYPAGALDDGYYGIDGGNPSGLAESAWYAVIQKVSLDGSFDLGSYGASGGGLVSVAFGSVEMTACTNNTSVRVRQYYRSASTYQYFLTGGMICQTSCYAATDPSIWLYDCVNNATVDMDDTAHNDRCLGGSDTGYGSMAYVIANGGQQIFSRKLNCAGMVGQLSGATAYLVQVVDCVNNGSVLGGHIDRFTTAGAFDTCVQKGCFVGRQWLNGGTEPVDYTIDTSDKSNLSFYPNDCVFFESAEPDDYSGYVQKAEGGYYRPQGYGSGTICRKTGGSEVAVTAADELQMLENAKRLIGPVVYNTTFLVIDTKSVAVVTTGETCEKFTSLPAAIEAAVPGSKVKLLQAASDDVVLPTGVTFNTNGKDYTGTLSAPDGGFIRDNGDGTFDSLVLVAEIRTATATNRYESIAAACAAVSDGETITLVKAGYTNEPALAVARDVAFALDLNGLTLASELTVSAGSLTLTNGTLTAVSTSAAAVTLAGGTLHIVDTAKIVGAPAVSVTSGYLNVTGGRVQGSSTNAVLLARDVTALVYGGTFLAPDGVVAIGYDETVAGGSFPTNFIFAATDAAGRETGYPLFGTHIPVGFIGFGHVEKDNLNGTWTVTAGNVEIRTVPDESIVPTVTNTVAIPPEEEQTVTNQVAEIKEEIIDANKETNDAELIGTGINEATKNDDGTIQDYVVEALSNAAPASVKGDITTNSTVESYIEIKLRGVGVTVSSNESASAGSIIKSTLTTVTYDVKPVVTTKIVTGGEVVTVTTNLEGQTLPTPVAFKLDLQKTFPSDIAQVTHEHGGSNIVEMCVVQTAADGSKWIELAWRQFCVTLVEAQTMEGVACWANGKVYDSVTNAIADAAVPTNATIVLLKDCGEEGIPLEYDQLIDRNGHQFTGTLTPMAEKETVLAKDDTVYRAPEKIDVATSLTTTIPIRGYTAWPSNDMTKAQKAVYLAENDPATGNPRWMAHVFGTNAKLLPQIVGAEEGFSTVVICAADGFTLDTPEKVGTTVSFNLLRKEAGGTFQTYTNAALPYFQLDVKNLSEKTYWKIQTVFESAEE